VPVIWTQEIRRLVAGRTGDTLKVDVIRDGKPMSFNVTIRQLTEKNAYGFDSYRGYMGPYWIGYGINIKYITQVWGL
jgi:hypothetical protein